MPTGAIINQQHSLDIRFEFFVYTSPVLGLFINNRLSYFMSVSERHFIQSYSVEFALYCKHIIEPYRLKRSCTIPSTYLQLEGFRNYIAAILTKWPQRYPLLARLGRSTVSVCQLSLSFSVHLSVLSACCVFILLHSVSLCSVVFLYSLSVTFCLPVCLLRGHFSVWGFVRPLAFEA